MTHLDLRLQGQDLLQLAGHLRAPHVAVLMSQQGMPLRADGLFGELRL